MVPLLQARDVGIMVLDQRAVLLEQGDHPQRGALPDVVDVLLVSGADDEQARAVYTLAPEVERLHRPLRHVVRHLGIYLAGELDELGLELELPCLPSEVERIDRNAVASQARSG